MDTVKIPERFFKDIKITSPAPEWINGELVGTVADITFQGALFDLTKSDYSKFESQNTALGFEDRKLYTKSELEFQLKMEITDHIGNKFRIVGIEDYRQNGHADLKVLFLERLKDGQDRTA